MAQVEVSGLFFRLILQIMYKMKALARNVFHNALLYIQSYNYLTDAEIGLSRNSHPLVSLAFSQIVLRHGLGSATRQHRSISVGISPANIPVTCAHLVQPESIIGIIWFPIGLQHKMILVKYTVPSQLMCSYVSYHYLLMSQHIQLVDVAFVSRN